MRKHDQSRFPIWAASLMLMGLLAFTSYGTADSNNFKTINLKGTLERFEYSYPNILIHLAVKARAGRIQHWLVEMSPPNEAEKVGWSKGMMKPGDRIVYEVLPAENGTPVARGGNIITVNGRKVGVLTRPERIVVQASTD
jgi:hypothetical protein